MNLKGSLIVVGPSVVDEKKTGKILTSTNIEA
jgi:hypothetical protein